MRNLVKLKRKCDPKDYRAVLYRVKLFRPLGVYPRGTFCTPTCLFHADDKIVFAVTYGMPWSGMSDDLPYSEANWLQPDLIRLLGALVMTEQFPEGHRCSFYPTSGGDFVVENESLDLATPSTALAVKQALLNTIGNRFWNKWVQESWSHCVGKKFLLFDPYELSIDLYQQYWENIDVGNHVLMRGLQALIKADMLNRYHEFQEEACIATFIALDASFEMVLRHLRASGIVNPSAKDAGDWLHRAFAEPWGHAPDGLKYFEEFYQQRVQTVHPGSRFGDMPFAPIMADDYIHLRQAIPGVFAYLTIGEHAPAFWDQIAQEAASENADDSI